MGQADFSHGILSCKCTNRPNYGTVRTSKVSI